MKLALQFEIDWPRSQVLDVRISGSENTPVFILSVIFSS
jgi:hypothetical protein